MGREWKPGDVAMVTAYNHPEPYRAYYCGRDETWRKCDSTAFCVDQPMTLHPLVVIDLPDGALAGWPVLIHALKVAREKTGFRMIFDGLIDQIEAQTADPTPPKPNEPTGLGAVVWDAGTRWTLAVRIPGSFPWVGEHGGVRGWNEFSDAVEVLSEGVTS
jgi:hypothetical protein